jgi:hypothetical protein
MCLVEAELLVEVKVEVRRVVTRTVLPGMPVLLF